MAQWFIARSKEKQGPYSREQLAALASEGILQDSDMVLQEGTRKWQPAREIPGLFTTPDATPVECAVPVAIPLDPAAPKAPGVWPRQWLFAAAGAAGAAGLCLILLVVVLFWAVSAPSADAALKADIQAIERLKSQGKGNASYIALHAPKRLTAWRQAAEAGSPEAQFLLSRCYAIGAGVAEDPELRMQWLRKAADQGHGDAQADLATIYWSGEGVTRDRAEAVRYIRMAAEKGLARAQVQLGICYTTGQGVAEDPVAAVEWFRKAADQGDTLGQTCLGLCYASGGGVAQDWKKAVELYQAAAEAGSVAAMNHLGSCYENGHGVARDPARAAAWYEKGAQKGDAEAMFRLGLCYAAGNGVQKEPALAAQWFDRSARAGYGPARQQQVASAPEPVPPGVPQGAFFNGKDLTGWEGLPRYWKVADGAIVGAPADGVTAHTFLCSQQTYRDFELRFKVRRKGGIGNSGVQFRSQRVNRQQFLVRGPQVEIEAATFSLPPGSVVMEPTGNPAVKSNASAIAKVWKEADFNDMSIRCVGTHVTVTVNGITAVDAEYPSMPAEGIIAWQLHGGHGEVRSPEEVTFKDIQFTDLGGDLLVKGSVWRGTSLQARSAAPQQIEVVVTGRNGQNFVGDMRWNGRHLRNIEGTIADGTIQWTGAKGESNKGNYNVGTLKGRRIEVKHFKEADSKTEEGALTLDYVPPRGSPTPRNFRPSGGDDATARQTLMLGLFLYALSGGSGGGGYAAEGSERSEWDSRRHQAQQEDYWRDRADREGVNPNRYGYSPRNLEESSRPD
jgi:TPR repeat protein